MTASEILRVALEQSAIDLSCHPQDLTAAENRIVRSSAHPDARRYLTLPFACNLVSYGSCVVASVSEELEAPVREYLARVPLAHCFETPSLHLLDDALVPLGYRSCFMAEYFLPDPDRLHPQPCAYSLRVLTQADFDPLYTPTWSNALCEKRRHLDVLGVGAYDGSRLIGLAGCSADCDTMWQIGIDVLPEYRRQGIACALTSRLALEILEREKVPFYCAAWCNLPSVRNAIKAGFRPAWAELTAKPIAFVNKMNQA
jgi:GNAT superfamily N-acetyltransferase